MLRACYGYTFTRGENREFDQIINWVVICAYHIIIPGYSKLANTSKYSKVMDKESE